MLLLTSEQQTFSSVYLQNSKRLILIISTNMKTKNLLFWITVTLPSLVLIGAGAQRRQESVHHFQRRALQEKALPRTNTTKRLADLRALMKAKNISAYIIPSTDAHQSEYISLHDKRRAFISGFTGSSGDAVVTMTHAALWTDGRYYVQAKMEMDSNWVLMKADDLITTEWLTKILKKGETVAIDPYLMSMDSYKSLKTELNKKGLQLKSLLPNLVDEIWTNQPPLPNGTLFPLSLKYTGKTWQEKTREIRLEMKKKKSFALVLYKMDEIAWLLNLRGSDVPYNPVFYSYIIVTLDQVTLFVDKNKITTEVRQHLQMSNCSSLCVLVKNYSQILDDLKNLSSSNDWKVWISPRGSQALAMNVNKTSLYLEYSPVVLPKSIKNDVEIKGMKNANLKDAVAMCELVEWLEKEVPKGRRDLTELMASAKLEEFKSKQEDYVSPSFWSIFGYGPNAAIIHYSPSKSSDRQITTDSTLLVDTGSQYKDGTCDTTRTFHFGTPSLEQKEAYTRVLKGLIQLSLMTWPNKTQGRFLDILARKELWAGGLDYRHGTGHGVGMFLNVHEGPQAISMSCSRSGEHPIVPGMFTSDEPGYYKEGSYGIRLETVFLAVPAKVKSHMPNMYFVTFEAANFMPYERKMILLDLLTDRELEYVNAYHRESRAKVGALLKKQNKMDTYDWLVKRTEPLSRNPVSDGSRDHMATAILLISGLAYLLF